MAKAKKTQNKETKDEVSTEVEPTEEVVQETVEETQVDSPEAVEEDKGVVRPTPPAPTVSGNPGLNPGFTIAKKPLRVRKLANGSTIQDN